MGTRQLCAQVSVNAAQRLTHHVIVLIAQAAVRDVVIDGGDHPTRDAALYDVDQGRDEQRVQDHARCEAVRRSKRRRHGLQMQRFEIGPMPSCQLSASMNVLEEGMFEDVDGDVRSQSKQDPEEHQQVDHQHQVNQQQTPREEHMILQMFRYARRQNRSFTSK